VAKGTSEVEGLRRAFEAACEAAQIPAAAREPLWKLHNTWVRKGLDDEQRLAELVRGYGHWRLYQASRTGDEQAAQSFQAYWKRTIRCFWGQGLKHDELEELSAAFFERVYRRVGMDFHWRCPFPVYLQALLVNLKREHWTRRERRRQREVGLTDSVATGTLAQARVEPTAEKRVLAHERQRAIQRAMFKLEPGDRLIIRVCLLEDGSREDLARDLGITRDAVYQRLRRAKQRLREYLENEKLIVSDS